MASKVPFPSVDDMASAFRACMAQATEDIRVTGEAWYREANAVAHRLCDIRTTWSLEISASVISALSPREKWHSNIAKSIAFAEGKPIRGLGANIRRAYYAERLGFAALKGRKTAAFARAVAGDTNAIVIDTWMLKASGCGRKSVTVKQYDAVALALAIVAKEVGMTPAATQAAIWIVARGAAY